MVAVISNSGIPLMPTSEYRARRFLKSGRAKIYKYRPFMIDPSSISGLPLTGGMGTKLLYIVGAALIAIGTAAYLRKKK